MRWRRVLLVSWISNLREDLFELDGHTDRFTQRLHGLNAAIEIGGDDLVDLKAGQGPHEVFRLSVPNLIERPTPVFSLPLGSFAGPRGAR